MRRDAVDSVTGGDHTAISTEKVLSCGLKGGVNIQVLALACVPCLLSSFAFLLILSLESTQYV